MSLSCVSESDGEDGYVEVSDELVIKTEPCKCLECKKEIAADVPHYMVRNWRFGNEDDGQDANGDALEGEEIDISNLPCCEECGDLAISVLDLGYCWEFGSLRSSIAEMKAESN